MSQRVAEDLVRPRRFGPKVVIRVDLHGVSMLGPGEQRTMIRWEWVEAIAIEADVIVRSATDEVCIPGGAFGVDAPTLARLLEEGRSIATRTDAISALNDR